MPQPRGGRSPETRSLSRSRERNSWLDGSLTDVRSWDAHEVNTSRRSICCLHRLRAHSPALASTQGLQPFAHVPSRRLRWVDAIARSRQVPPTIRHLANSDNRLKPRNEGNHEFSACYFPVSSGSSIIFLGRHLACNGSRADPSVSSDMPARRSVRGRKGSPLRKRPRRRYGPLHHVSRRLPARATVEQ